MPVRRLGTSGQNVSAIGMGCMPLSLGGRPDEADALATIHAAAEAGITFFDTADSYCLDHTDVGHNERLLAKALKGRPEAIIATKGGHIRPNGGWQVDGRPDYLRAACEASLKALGQEAITLYQFHRPDPKVPFAESLGALADLQREGKIVHIGLSNVSVIQLEAARSIAKIVSVQNRMNVFDRSSMDVLKRCEELDIAFLPYSPLNGMGKAGQIGEHDVLARIAAAHEASPQQVALAWLLQLSPLVIPIPGASRSASIQNSAAAYRVELSAEDIAALDAFVAV
ncbi:aldo/keto reductase [Paenibacillus athensensis]|uniref:Aldo/keto reductase n=2 Tax=Paenibacillus athensensis TaxID=1967502 RepID=A0A4Y8Q1Q8_9BACL|nr:aldo/keto reductase [Paenibacillus athensensis]